MTGVVERKIKTLLCPDEDRVLRYIDVLSIYQSENSYTGSPIGREQSAKSLLPARTKPSNRTPALMDWPRLMPGEHWSEPKRRMSGAMSAAARDQPYRF
jgi:hypothetical protein